MDTSYKILISSMLFGTLLILGLGVNTLAADDALTLQIKDIQSRAQGYVKNGNIPQAVTEYQKIPPLAPASDVALDSQAKIVRLYLQNPLSGDAKTTMGQLKKDYSSLPEYVKCVHELAWDFVMHKDYDTAVQMYTDLKDQFPAHERAPWFLRSIVQAYLEEGDMTKVAEAIETQKNSLKDHAEYVKQLHETAVRLRWKKMYAQAADIYDYLLTNKPDCREAAMLKCQQIKTLLEMDKLPEAKVEVGKLTIYKSDPNDPVKNDPNDYVKGDPNNYVVPVHELGWDFVARGEYDTALQIYQGLKTQFPAHDRAPWFQRSIIQTYLEKEDQPNLAAAVQELKNDFKGCKDYVTQMETTGDRLMDRKQYGLAKGICESLLEQYPGSDRGIWFLQKKIRAELGLGSEPSADADIKVLHQKYAQNKDYHDAFSWTAYEYRTHGHYDKAIAQYQDLYAKNPNSKVQLRCDEGIARCHVRLGDDEKVQEQIDRIYANYTDNLSGVTFYMYGIGEEYYKMAQEAETAGDPNQLSTQYYSQAIEVWKRQLTELPANDNANFVYFLGLSYQNIGQMDQAVVYYQQLVDTFPTYKKAWYGQYQMARIYEIYMEQGKATADDVKQAYQVLLEKYPNCSAAKVATRKLDTL